MTTTKQMHTIHVTGHQGRDGEPRCAALYREGRQTPLHVATRPTTDRAIAACIAGAGLEGRLGPYTVRDGHLTVQLHDVRKAKAAPADDDLAKLAQDIFTTAHQVAARAQDETFIGAAARVELEYVRDLMHDAHARLEAVVRESCRRAAAADQQAMAKFGRGRKVG